MRLPRHFAVAASGTCVESCDKKFRFASCLLVPSSRSILEA